LEACGTSWEKDVANLNLLISTHDGGVADMPAESYLDVHGDDEVKELNELYRRMEEAIDIWDNDFDLEFMIRKQLEAYLPIISGARMFKDYLSYLFGNIKKS
jgi:glucan phosphorylase